MNTILVIRQSCFSHPLMQLAKDPDEAQAPEKGFYRSEHMMLDLKEAENIFFNNFIFHMRKPRLREVN